MAIGPDIDAEDMTPAEHQAIKRALIDHELEAEFVSQVQHFWKENIAIVILEPNQVIRPDYEERKEAIEHKALLWMILVELREIKEKLE